MGGAGLSATGVLELWEGLSGRLPAEQAVRLAARATGTTDLDAVARLPLGTRDRAIVALRTTLSAGPFQAVASCPACGATLDIELDPSRLWAGTAGPSGGRVEVDGIVATFRSPDSVDVLALLARGIDDAVEAAAVLLERCLVSAQRGTEAVPAASLPERVRDAIDDALGELDPDAVVTVESICPECGTASERGCEPGEFVALEVTAAARRTVGEVDVIASAYGWSEDCILAMTPARRRAYLELAAG